jgi:hypothetical protein
VTGFDPIALQQRFSAEGWVADLGPYIPAFLFTRHNNELAGAIRLA